MSENYGVERLFKTFPGRGRNFDVLKIPIGENDSSDNVDLRPRRRPDDCVHRSTKLKIRH